MAAKSLSNAAAIAAANAIVDLLDVGAGANGLLRIYAGTAPADADTALGAQVLLAELAFSDPAFGAAVDGAPGGVATANAISDDTAADATGVATFFRALDKDGNTIFQGDVSVTAGGGDLQLNTTSLVIGATVSVTAMTATMPEA